MPSVGPTSFGDLLRQFRFAAGLTQEALAERAALSVHGIQKLERGATRPYRDTLQRLTLALQLPPHDEGRFKAAAQPAPRRKQARPQPAGASTPHGRAAAGLLVAHPSRTPFVGRRGELNLLTERLGSAREGRGSLVLVAGEPGIGKTRLVFELGQRACSEGWQVMSGRAYDSDGMPPYFPLAEALRAYVRACRSKELRTRLGKNAADVALVVPEVRDRLPDMPAATAGIDEYGRFRVFESVSEFVLAIASSPPGAGLLLCLDDLHWADQSTLLLLEYLARKAPSAPLLVVGAYRTTELTRMHPLADVLADLRRDELAERLLLTSLSAADTRTLIEGLTGAPASAAVADAIYRETDGHPFFVGEVVRQLQADGRNLADVHAATMQWGIPEGVREVIGRRLSRLPAASNRLLQTAAVLGEDLTVDVLQAVSGLDGSTLVDALEDAVGAGMLREEGARYAFTHALIRETLYEELSLARKQRLHRQAGDALMHAHARNLRPHVGTIAVHYRLAGLAAEPETTLEWARRAGEASAAVFAWKEAAGHWHAALELASPDDTEVRCDLLLALGKVLLPAGQPRRVVDEIAPEAVLLAEALGDHRRALQASVLALEGLGTAGAAGAFYTAEGRGWAERADRYAQPASVERVIADAFLSQTLSPLDRRAERRALQHRALNLARKLADPEALAYAGIQVLREGAAADWEERVALADELASRPREGIRMTRLVLLLQDCATVFVTSGQRARAEDLWHEVETLAKRFQDPNLATQQLRNAALTALLDGHLETAVTTLADLVAQAERAGQGSNGRANASAVFLRLLLHLGRVEEALAFYAELRRAVKGEASEMYVPAVALCLAHLGRQDEARENLVGFMGAHPLDPDAAPLVLVQLLEAAVLVEDHARAATLSKWLAGQAARAIAGNDPTCIARHVGAARMLLGDQVSARTSYLHALEVAGRVRFRPELALIHLQLAELGLAQSAEPGAAQERTDRRSEALRHLNVAIPELRDMQMQPALARATALHARIAAPVYPDRLTPREVEILCRIAAGRTNQEIAEDLILSIRTVERHITNLYGKIGARGKADATTYALRQGLA